MKDLTALNAELAVLNAEVDAAVKKRTDWMDAHMGDYAEVQVGEPIYKLSTGQRMGIVSRLYRYWGPDRNGIIRNIEFDRSMNVDYEFESDGMPRCFDNTSRQDGGFAFGRKDQVYRRTEQDWEKIFK